MASNRERVFVTELRDSFEFHGAFFYKISDMPHFLGSMTRFDAPKPFDVFVAFQGVPIAIEAKAMKDYKAFGLNQLRLCQIDGLSSFAKNGKSYVFLNIRNAGCKTENKKRMNRLIIIDWFYLKAKGTIKKNELLELPYIEKEKIFKLSDWLYYEVCK